MSNTNKESWDKHAQRFYVEGYLSLDDIDFGSYEYPTNKDLNIIGNVKGLNVLEIGSGSCNCGIALARKGANVTCSDISQEQLNIGMQVAKSAGVNIKFKCSDMADLSFVETGVMDLVISMSALDYVEDFNKVCSEVSRVLKKGGRFVFCCTHPMMFCIGATELWPEEKANPNYNYRGPVEWKWNKDDSYVFTTYRRQLSDYINGLAVNRLYATRMEELFPITPLPDDHDFDENEIKIRTRYPSILVVEATKIAE
ncbi:MAG: class I SAM-dependent methyltransferase [Defluviitaleaceae bacterium]|nr:class I SAM-dependent methyltransferase [Defluviitaleaceae bacterium]